MPRTEKRATAATNIVDKHDLERRKEQEKCIRAISGGKEAIDEKWGGGGGGNNQWKRSTSPTHRKILLMLSEVINTNGVRSFQFN